MGANFDNPNDALGDGSGAANYLEREQYDDTQGQNDVFRSGSSMARKLGSGKVSMGGGGKKSGGTGPDGSGAAIESLIKATPKSITPRANPAGAEEPLAASAENSANFTAAAPADNIDRGVGRYVEKPPPDISEELGAKVGQYLGAAATATPPATPAAEPEHDSYHPTTSTRVAADATPFAEDFNHAKAKPTADAARNGPDHSKSKELDAQIQAEMTKLSNIGPIDPWGIGRRRSNNRLQTLMLQRNELKQSEINNYLETHPQEVEEDGIVVGHALVGKKTGKVKYQGQDPAKAPAAPKFEKSDAGPGYMVGPDGKATRITEPVTRNMPVMGPDFTPDAAPLGGTIPNTENEPVNFGAKSTPSHVSVLQNDNGDATGVDTSTGETKWKKPGAGKTKAKSADPEKKATDAKHKEAMARHKALVASNAKLPSRRQKTDAALQAQAEADFGLTPGSLFTGQAPSGDKPGGKPMTTSAGSKYSLVK